ncbi:S49 family peptidase [Facilibium subflavum]|uniref:S49 family peptidase n=1 Tax=Facilibium subflavum TaxID=2219058 RepID=UPI000E65942A|nr:S49 family peptidase [Facilibium subflavum]
MSEHLERIANAYLKEQRRSRRWRIFFRLCWLVIVVFILVSIFKDYSEKGPLPKSHIALIKLDGVISDDAVANAKRINESLENAFKSADTKAVFLQINSPGGSPVQSDEIYQQIRYLEQKHPKIPVYAICTDVCASGGYYVASAAQKIYANKMTITGSIGVRAGGFGFVDLMKKIGVERRLYTAGKDKGFLDPFEPQSASQVSEMEKMLSQTHEVFIDAVKAGRGDRLDKRAEDKLFSGMPFSGIQAKRYGLIDDFGSVTSVAREQFKGLPIIDYTQPLSLTDRISKAFGNEIIYQAASLAHVKLQ